MRAIDASHSRARSASTFCMAGWSMRQFAEGPAMGRVVDCLRDGLPHQCRRADDAIEPRVGDHLDDRRHAASLFADELGPRVVVLDLARGVGAVAELIFEPLDGDRVLRPVGFEPRDEEARQAPFGLREREKRVIHDGRAEPFVTREQVFATGAAAADRSGSRRVGADVGTPLLFGHRHADERAFFLGGRDEAAVVDV